MRHTIYKNSNTRSTRIKQHVQYTQSLSAVYSVKVSDIYKQSSNIYKGITELCT